GGGGEGEDASESPQIVVSLYPVQFLAEAIAGEDAEVSNVVPAGAEPHDVELGPRDVFAMGEADLVVTVSGFQPAVDAAAADSENVLDIAATVDLIERDGALGPPSWLEPASTVTAKEDHESAI